MGVQEHFHWNLEFSEEETKPCLKRTRNPALPLPITRQLLLGLGFWCQELIVCWIKLQKLVLGLGKKTFEIKKKKEKKKNRIKSIAKSIENIEIKIEKFVKKADLANPAMGASGVLSTDFGFQ